MKRFKNILLAVKEKDIDSAQIVAQATSLAAANGAKLSVITVFNELPDTVEAFLQENYDFNLDKEVIEKTKDDIRAKLEQTKDLQIGNIEVAFGEPWLRIIQHVLRWHNDLVIISGTEQASLMKRIFGSTTMKLLRKCPAAVWVMNPPKTERGETGVLAAIDHKHDSDSVNEINDAVISLAASIAEKAQVKLHLLQGWRHFGEELQRGHWGLEEAELKDLLQKEHDEHKARLDKCIARTDISKVEHEIHLAKGDAGRLIESYIKDKGISLLVMGTVCRTGVSGFIIGNTAEKILRNVTCSVLALKPKGFISPVELDD